MNPHSMQSAGGKARAAALSPARRSEIARQAAATRWNIPDAAPEKPRSAADAPFAQELHALVAKYIPQGLTPERAAKIMTLAAWSALHALTWKTKPLERAHKWLTRALAAFEG